MDLAVQSRFMELWKRYFKNAELPIAFYYSKNIDEIEVSKNEGNQGNTDHKCLICELAKIRKGSSLAFGKDHIGCLGGRKYAGFTETVRPDFEHFLSCGKKGLEGERFKQDPETVRLMMEDFPKIHKKNQWLIFKRWDKLTEADQPEVVIFFAEPHALSGLFMLANYDFVGNAGVIAPFTSGCGSIILFPYLEKDKEKAQSVIGMFDPSARPCVKDNELTFATPYNRLLQLISYMEESFLITDTWSNINKRMP